MFTEIFNGNTRASSTPAGANIQVDGAYVGATPADIDLTCCSGMM